MCSASEESLHKGGFVTTSRLCWKHTSIPQPGQNLLVEGDTCRRLYKYIKSYFSVWLFWDFISEKNDHSLLSACDGKVKVSREGFQRSTLQHQAECLHMTVMSWYTASFKCSIIHHNENLHLWLVNHKWPSERVVVCKQTDQRPQAFSSHTLRLFTTFDRRMECLFVYLFLFVWFGLCMTLAVPFISLLAHLFRGDLPCFLL